MPKSKPRRNSPLHGNKRACSPGEEEKTPQSQTTRKRRVTQSLLPLTPGYFWPEHCPQSLPGQATPHSKEVTLPNASQWKKKRENGIRPHAIASPLDNGVLSGFQIRTTFLLFGNGVPHPRLLDGAGKRPWTQA